MNVNDKVRLAAGPANVAAGKSTTDMNRKVAAAAGPANVAAQRGADAVNSKVHQATSRKVGAA